MRWNETEVFKHFEKDGEFVCIAGQSTQAVTGMLNLYRASDQVMFPGEKILEDAKQFASKFLRQKQAANQLLDKWIITKDLPGEVNPNYFQHLTFSLSRGTSRLSCCPQVGYALDVPWFASLPRVETRLYIQHYGGKNDVWIGKTLYRYYYYYYYLCVLSAFIHSFIHSFIHPSLTLMNISGCSRSTTIHTWSLQNWTTTTANDCIRLSGLIFKSNLTPQPCTIYLNTL